MRFRDGEKTFSGRIILVNPYPDTLHNKAYLEASLQEFPGIIGDRVEVLLSRNIPFDSSAVVLPNSAIISWYGEPGVYILE